MFLHGKSMKCHINSIRHATIPRWFLLRSVPRWCAYIWWMAHYSLHIITKYTNMQISLCFPHQKRQETLCPATNKHSSFQKKLSYNITITVNAYFYRMHHSDKSPAENGCTDLSSDPSIVIGKVQDEPGNEI